LSVLSYRLVSEVHTSFVNIMILWLWKQYFWIKKAFEFFDFCSILRKRTKNWKIGFSNTCKENNHMTMKMKAYLVILHQDRSAHSEYSQLYNKYICVNCLIFSRKHTYSSLYFLTSPVRTNKFSNKSNMFIIEPVKFLSDRSWKYIHHLLQLNMIYFHCIRDRF